MSRILQIPERGGSPTSRDTQSPSSQTSTMKSQRILACVLCQQRKVKCDRKFPCSNCVKQQVHCVPATQTRKRRRRFPERELLDRLLKYEHILRQNNIDFQPLHGDLPIKDELLGAEYTPGYEQLETTSPAPSLDSQDTAAVKYILFLSSRLLPPVKLTCPGTSGKPYIEGYGHLF